MENSKPLWVGFAIRDGEDDVGFSGVYGSRAEAIERIRASYGEEAAVFSMNLRFEREENVRRLRNWMTRKGFTEPYSKLIADKLTPYLERLYRAYE